MKLEVLIRLYGALWDLGASSALDERLAGDRTRRQERDRFQSEKLERWLEAGQDRSGEIRGLMGRKLLFRSCQQYEGEDFCLLGEV